MLERKPLSAEQKGQLAALAAAGGLYRLRLPSSAAPGAPPVVTAFPPHCLAVAGADQGLALDLLDARHVAAIALNAPCTARGAAAAIGSDLQLPASQVLALHLPKAAPEVLPPLVGPAGIGMPVQPGPSAVAGAGQAQGQQQQVQESGEGAQPGGAAPGGKKAPPPDDRTWLQKNWMMVLPLGFIVRFSTVDPAVVRRNGMGAAVAPVGLQLP